MLRIVLLAVVVFGSSVPAFAQIDLAGTWAMRNHEDWQDRWMGPFPGDFTGLPINEDGLARALAYSPSLLAMPERQCLYYGPSYLVIGPFGLRIWSESEPVDNQVVAWKISGAVDRTPRTIWMDGRPHPSPAAPHTLEGFSTGHWQGPVLVVTTTHMKAGPLRRNGVPMSAEAVMTEHITRYDDKLTVVAVIDDPAYLEEPRVISRTWQADQELDVAIYPDPCNPVIEAPGLAAESVPHYLPGQNPFESEMVSRYGLPLEAVQGGARTLYPEYREVLEELYTRPAVCEGRYCRGWEGGGTGNNGGSARLLGAQ